MLMDQVEQPLPNGALHHLVPSSDGCVGEVTWHTMAPTTSGLSRPWNSAIRRSATRWSLAQCAPGQLPLEQPRLRSRPRWTVAAPASLGWATAGSGRSAGGGRWLSAVGGRVRRCHRVAAGPDRRRGAPSSLGGGLAGGADQVGELLVGEPNYGGGGRAGRRRDLVQDLDRHGPRRTPGAAGAGGALPARRTAAARPAASSPGRRRAAHRGPGRGPGRWAAGSGVRFPEDIATLQRWSDAKL